MAIQADAVITRVARLLVDEGHETWTRGELVGWLNDGQRAVVREVATAYTDDPTVNLESGTKQTLPSDAVRLLEVVRNIGSDGVTAGRAVRAVNRAVLDRDDPDWHTRTASATVRTIAFDPKDPTHFYVTPPNDGNGKLHIVVSKVPPKITAIDNMAIADIYVDAVIDYMLFRAYSKDLEGTGAQTDRALKHLEAFRTILAGKESADATVGN